MKCKIFVTVLIGLLFPYLGYASVNQDHDFQLWLYNAVNKEISKKSKLYLEGEIRYGDDASRLYLFYLQTRWLYTLCKRLDIGPGYRQLYVLNIAINQWVPIYEPLVDVFLKFEAKKWQITNRNRFSHLFIDSGENLWQYRNRILVQSSWKLGKMKFNPQFFDEIFVRESVGFFENRFGIGGMIPIKKKGKASIFYMLRHIEILEEWRRHNVIWILFDFAF